MINFTSEVVNKHKKESRIYEIIKRLSLLSVIFCSIMLAINLYVVYKGNGDFLDDLNIILLTAVVVWNVKISWSLHKFLLRKNTVL